MSQTPLDQPAAAADPLADRANSSATPEATGAAPARRRHRRAPSRRAGTPNEPATQPAVEAAAAAVPTAAEAPAPAERPTSPTPAAEAENTTAPAPVRAATGTRRRVARPRAPQLVTPPRPEPAAVTEVAGPASAETVPAETLAPAVAPAPEAGAALSGAGDIALTRQPDAGAVDTATDTSFEARIETVAPGDVAQAAESEAAPRPRRYRFDRPAPRVTPAPAPAFRSERLTPTPTAPAPTPPTPAAPAAPAAHVPEAQAEPTSAPETEDLLSLLIPSAPAAPVEAPPAPAAETPAPDAHETGAPLDDVAQAEGAVGSPHADEAALEEGETAGGAEGDASQTSRRRRRRRRNGTAAASAVRHLEAIAPADHDAEPTPIPARPGQRPEESLSYDEPFHGYGNRVDAYPPFEEQAGGSAPYSPAQQEGWHVASAYEQMREPRSPFGAPEPYAPRGFGSQPQGVAAPFHDRPVRTSRTERPTDVPPMSSNQLGTLITHAIQQQTDRLLTELRHTQAPPSMTVMFPPLPSTERVGLFVDVANLLYSSRNMRVSIDFGRLLEFLRGNRRLVRAHAYAPTSPEPHAEQQFLSVVKGVGYRITTKNYKTFSNGAKKADLDLDMCMDIVRMVDARAIDTVVLVSGDSDFLPLLEYCSDHGVRVEVAAFDDAASMVLRQSCDLFVNLSLVDEIRA